MINDKLRRLIIPRLILTMQIHQPSHVLKGSFLAINTAILWGLLPLALKSVLNLMDAATITWYRFIFAAVAVTLFLAFNKNIPVSIFKCAKQRKQLIFAGIFLSINYICYSLSLAYVHAETAQMLIQMAPFFMTIGSIIFLKEQFTKGQFIGSVLLVSGLLLFFNQQFTDDIPSANSDFLLGFLIMLVAALTWAAYAIIQKNMLKRYSSNQIMWGIYLLSSIFFLPLSTPSQIQSLDITALLLLVFCCTNTLLAYGTFAKAQEYLPSAQVSAIIAITPLLTVLFATIAESIFPNFIQAQQLNILAYIGSAMVVTGSMLTALGDRMLNKRREYKKLKATLNQG